MHGIVQTDALVNSPGGGASRQFRRPDVVAGVNPFIQGGDRLAYLNPAAFAVPLPGTYGNLGRNALAGPDLAQMDLTLHKRLPVTEGVNLEFRAEIYNLLNRTNLDLPDSFVDRPTFGQSLSADRGRLAQLAARFLF